MREVYGDLFALMTILKGLPIGYNRDLQEDKRIVFRAFDTVSGCLAMATAIVDSANFIKENIEPTLERGFLDATSLAEYLVTKGVPFRTAHQIVGGLVVKCEKEREMRWGSFLWWILGMRLRPTAPPWTLMRIVRVLGRGMW